MKNNKKSHQSHSKRGFPWGYLLCAVLIASAIFSWSHSLKSLVEQNNQMTEMISDEVLEKN